MIDPLRLPTRDAEGAVVAVIETPRGSPNKMRWDPRLGAFRLAKVLSAGMMFPFDFGFIPGTRAADGDPLDIVVLLGAPVCTGSVVPCRLVAVLEAEQREQDADEWIRNDRLIGVPLDDGSMDHVRDDGDIDEKTMRDLGAFFVDYNELDGKGFRVLRHRGPKAAERLLEEAVAR
jgi:inorganic pyrophosphatase